jgi:inosine-uridine nucleoside N-ribohydrolase
VGLGAGKKEGRGKQKQELWVEDYRLDDYPGTVHEDGVGVLIETIMESKEPLTVIAIGPVSNLEVALKREPKIATKARFVGMHGSIYVGYGGRGKPAAEFNVKCNPEALQAVFAAPWPVTITPLDTCGIVHVRGKKYAKVRDSQDPLIRALMENYRIWSSRKDGNLPGGSSTLFDTVAIYLAATDAGLCRMETLPLRVTDKGMTVIDKDGGRPVQAAVKWKDLDAFEDWMVERLLSPTVRP